MNGDEIIFINENHEEEIQRLLHENVMDGEIQLSLERHSGYLRAADVEGHRHYAVASIDPATKKLRGMGSRSINQVFYEGEEKALGYLGQLRIDPKSRIRHRSIKQCYSKLHHVRREPGELPFDITTILANNGRARRFLEANLRGMPVYQPMGTLLTLTFQPGTGKAKSCQSSETRIRHAGSEDLQAIAKFLQQQYRSLNFAPVWTKEKLTSSFRCRDLHARDFFLAIKGRDRIVGCAALWDQNAYKQVVVRGYAPALRRIRPIYNLFARLTGKSRLPPVGQILNQVFVSHVAVDESFPQIIIPLLQTVFKEAEIRGYSYLSLGLAEDNLLLPCIKQHYKPHITESIIYRVFPAGHSRTDLKVDPRKSISNNGKPNKIHLEIALL